MVDKLIIPDEIIKNLEKLQTFRDQCGHYYDNGYLLRELDALKAFQSEFDISQIHAFLKVHRPDVDTDEILSITAFGAGQMNMVFKLPDSSDGQAQCLRITYNFIRIAGDRARVCECLSDEVKILTFLGQEAPLLPIPRVLAFDPTTFRWPMTLMTRMPGRPLPWWDMPLSSQIHVTRQVSTYIGLLSSIPLPEKFQANLPTVENFASPHQFGRYLNGIFYRAHQELAGDSEAIELIDRLGHFAFKTAPWWKPEYFWQPTLIHGDADNFSNFLIDDDNSITGILDWSGCSIVPKFMAADYIWKQLFDDGFLHPHLHNDAYREGNFEREPLRLAFIEGAKVYFPQRTELFEAGRGLRSVFTFEYARHRVPLETLKRRLKIWDSDIAPGLLNDIQSETST